VQKNSLTPDIESRTAQFIARCYTDRVILATTMDLDTHNY